MFIVYFILIEEIHKSLVKPDLILIVEIILFMSFIFLLSDYVLSRQSIILRSLEHKIVHFSLVRK